MKDSSDWNDRVLESGSPCTRLENETTDVGFQVDISVMCGCAWWVDTVRAPFCSMGLCCSYMGHVSRGGTSTGGKHLIGGELTANGIAGGCSYKLSAHGKSCRALCTCFTMIDTTGCRSCRMGCH